MEVERAEHVRRVAEVERAGDDPLRGLVGEHSGPRDGAEPEPLVRARRERALGDRDGRQAVGCGADPDVDRPWRGLAHLARAQSMQSSAQGSASSRSSPIGFPQFVQTPYVPSSIRPSAASIAPSSCVSLSVSV